MGITFNPFTGTLDFTGSGGGGGGTIGGSIAATQVAFGSGVNTITGSSEFIYDGTTLNVGNTNTVIELYNVVPRIQALYDITGDAIQSLINTELHVTPTDDATRYLGSQMGIVLLGSHDVYRLWGQYLPTFHEADGDVTDALGMVGHYVDTALTGTGGTIANLRGVVSQLTVNTGYTVPRAAFFDSGDNYAVTGTITNLYGTYQGAALTSGGGAITNQFQFYGSALAGGGTNLYSFWADEQGVYRIRADNTFNSVYQAIPALYNPQFTKYTPGAANYERIVWQWESNVATVTTEKGGTGTLRALNLGDASVQVQVNGKNLTLSGNLTTSGAFNPTFAIPSSSTWTFPSGGGTLLLSNGSGTALVFPGLLSIASGKTLTASNTLTFTGTDSTSFTFPGTSDTVVALAATQTLTNKRITKRVVTAADATSITPNTDSADVTYQANTQGAGTLTINADTGTPTNGQSWLLKLKSTNAQTFAWNAVFVGGTVALPTVSTGGTKTDYYAFLYSTVGNVWQFTGSALGF